MHAHRAVFQLFAISALHPHLTHQRQQQRPGRRGARADHHPHHVCRSDPRCWPQTRMVAKQARYPKGLPRPRRHCRRRCLLAGGPRCRKAHRFGGQIGGKLEHTAQKIGQWRALMLHDGLRQIWQGRNDLRGFQNNAMRGTKGLKHLGGIGGGVAHRQPAAAVLAQSRFRHRPAVGLIRPGFIGKDRHIARGHTHRSHSDGWQKPLAPRIHRQRPIRFGAFPFKIHPVEIQHQPAHRRVIADIVGLIGGNPVTRGQGTRIGQKPPRDLAQPARRQCGHQIAHLVGVKRRIAAACQNQITVQPPICNRPHPHHPRGKLVGCPQLFQRVKRRHRFADRGGRQGHGVIAGYQNPPCGQIGHREPDHSAQLGGCDQISFGGGRFFGGAVRRAR